MTCKLVVPLVAGVAHYPPKATYGPRTLRDFEFVWLQNGSASWDCGDRSTHLRPGTLLLAQSGMRDHYSWDAERPSSHAYVHFQVLDTGDLGSPETWPLARSLHTTDPGSPLGSLCDYLVWVGSNRSSAALERTSQVVGWLLDLFVRGPVPDKDARRSLPPHLLRMAEAIRSAWGAGVTQPLPVAELARAAGVSPGYLSRLFRHEYAMGPAAALELVRLARAATLLQRSNLPVGAVAAACGFADPFHFSRRFRKVYGMSPRAYRAADNGDNPHEPLVQKGLLPLAHRLGSVD